MIWFPARTKRILEKIADGRLKKAQAAQILSVSRKTIYKWLNRYIQLPRISRDKLTKEILAVVIANPSLGPKKIALVLQKSFNNVSSGRIWQLLKENSLNTAKLRRDYASNYRLPTQAADPDHPRYLRLNSYTRKRMVEAVILGGAKVNQIVGTYHTSHKTFFKWKKRYFEAQSKDLTILPAMADQNPIGSEHPRGVDENTEQAVLSLVATVPNLSSHQIARNLGIIGNHGVQRVLERANLSRLTDRIRFAAEQKTLAKPSFPPTEERAMLDGKEFIPNLAPIPPPVPGVFRITFRSVAVTLSLLVIFSGIFVFWIRMLAGVGSFSQVMGLILATIALIVGTFFFLYSLKYYITLAIILSFSQQSLEVKEEEVETKRKGFLSWFLGIASRRSFMKKKRKPVGLEPNLDHVTLRRYPAISVHIPFYNEKNVVERAIAANTNFDYPEYEVILADDSKDSTTDIILNYLKKYGPPKITEGDGFTLAEVTVKPGVVLKHLHRTSRAGFKGAALKLALQYTNPKAEFISIFDADFVPYPDSLTLFLKYFKEHNNLSEDYESTNVAAVQGYQWHVLNKSENWITRGVRTEYAGSYVIERSGTELYGGLKMIAGSVYMIRRKVLEDIGWGASITEDYELTLKLYEKGYKVVYTPYIQGPAECVSTLKRFIRQRMRWAEGHSFNTKIMFLRLLLNRNLTRAEKLEFLYLIPYYLQAFLFMVGTIAWLVSETILRAGLPFWTSLWGWSLVLTNLIALPLVNIVGLFLEESEEKDYMGILSFVVLSYLMVPFQAYAALKGFLEKEEGNWFRTPKTGRITDVFSRGRFYRLISGIFTRGKLLPATSSLSFENVIPNSYLALSTANNRFEDFKISRRRMRGLSISLLAILLIISSTLIYLAPAISTFVPEGMAAGSFVTGQKGKFLRQVVNLGASPVYAQSYGSPDPDGWREQLNKRTSNSKTKQLFVNDQPTSKYSLDSSIGEIHYKDNPNNPVESWKEIDTGIQPVTDPNIGYDYQNTANNFKSYFKKESTARQTVRYEYNGSFITFTNQDNELGKLRSVAGYAKDNQFIYPEAYEGIDVKYSIGTRVLLEEFVLKRPRDVSRISQRVHFEDAEYREQKDGSINFYSTKTNELIWSFPKPKMYELNERKDENGPPSRFDNFGLHYEIAKEGDDYIVTKVLDREGKDWLNSPERIYPLVIDTTVDKQVAASANDGVRFTGTWGFTSTDVYTTLGYNPNAGALHAHNFARWIGVTIGGTITASYIEYYASAYELTAELKVYGVDEDNPAAPIGRTSFDADPLTTAAVDWDGAWSPNSWAQSPSLNAIFQELVDTYTISNEAVMVQVKNDHGVTGSMELNYARMWDYAGNLHGPKLHIEYTTNSAPSTPTLNSPTDTATDVSTTLALQTTATDPDSDNLRYKIQVATDSIFTQNLQTFDQTVSQTGWSGQNADTSTAYTSGTQATYTVQSALSENTTYYWRSYAIDYAGSNTWSGTQAPPYSFVTVPEWGIVFILLVAFLTKKLREKTRREL